ncbi:uncharacterized protein Z520_01084 [Fonsecaea multimorphosa CBS 102226]|uniref:Uncharacterized protein n=1 Tax=Fonsecaea multimorphosa CBS 102226 TaxID=1442371 RepID=A0A0D2L0Q2_9EURO|nr:uncharacterized protein Z520_01084 [Fonsecaea multimorphosa CBS 102226]KIY02619.1 hypothetical protein Z520_01084 [Fonsecaea multimorphosa CBS 102226]OAL31483.1 hypothetical protein AYO22_01075 [Fonsecaea multimorphosa]
MPPLRTTTTPREKPPKSTRTQEENQERAYIAASRRSDRTLEARVESARRASEVHKRRTGRALRITAEDVMNEEMYEEEGDDLPIQYRRLTAHLQTSSADFNRRVAAYLTHQVAIRSAIEQMARDPHGQYPGGGLGMFPSPMLPPQSMPPSLGAYQRPAPYPSPHQAHFPQNSGRRASFLTSPTEQEPTSPPAPVHPPGPMEPANVSFPAPTQVGDNFSGQRIKDQSSRADLECPPQGQSATSPQSRQASFTPLWQDMGPFTTSLPPESQQMLAHAPGFDVNDPFYAMLMRGSDQYLSNSYYPWKNTQDPLKGMCAHDSTYQGMNATLAPAALDTPEETPKGTSTSASTTTATHTSVSAEPANTDNLQTPDLDFALKEESREPSFFVADDGLETGQTDPSADGFWDHFVRDGSWEGGDDEVHALTSENNVKVETHD